MQRLKVSAANLLWFLYSAGMSRKWKRATHDVAGTQHNVLKRIISSNVDSEFGQEHHFTELASVAAYQHSVPIRSYEEFKPYIERIAVGTRFIVSHGAGVLTSEHVLQFGLTSGSTQASKLIPYTKALINEFQHGIDPWVYYLFRSFPRIFLGKAYWSVTPIGERKSHTTGGIAIGFDDEQQYFSPLTRWVLNSIMVVPSQLAQLRNMELFRYVTLRLLLQEKSLSWVSIWNPSFLTLLLDPLPELFSQLTQDIRQGSLSVASEIELPLRNIIVSCCRRNPARARELEALHSNWQSKPFTERNTAGRTLYEALWPELQLISCWAHGNAAHALPQLKAYFPHSIIQPKGLLATEAFISFPFSAPIHSPDKAARGQAGGLSRTLRGQVECNEKDDVSALSLLSHFFEFEAVNETAPAIKLAHELQAGQRYSVIVTTGGGLYRYRLNDLIEVVDFYQQCPLIRFIGRQSKVVDICGEKLNEEYVRGLVTDIVKKHTLNVPFWMMAPEWGRERMSSRADVGTRFIASLGGEGARPFYTLFIQFNADVVTNTELLRSIADEIDEGLQESYHYGYCRRLGQLESCRLFIIAPDSDAFHTYLTVCTELGQRLGDIKPTALHSYQEWSHRFIGKFV